MVGILRIDPIFSLLTTDTMDIPLERASAAVSGNLVIDDSIVAREDAAEAAPSLEGDEWGDIESALNAGIGGRNCTALSAAL